MKGGWGGRLKPESIQQKSLTGRAECDKLSARFRRDDAGDLIESRLAQELADGTGHGDSIDYAQQRARGLGGV